MSVAIAALSAFMSGCALFQSNLMLGWPSIGGACKWMDIDTNLLKPAESSDINIELDPYYSQQNPSRFYHYDEYETWPPNRENLQEDVVLHIYSYLTVEGHYFGTGTYVYYLQGEDIFYLWGNDFMDHTDGMVGPFLGDPREELPQAASRMTTPIMARSWWCDL